MIQWACVISFICKTDSMSTICTARIEVAIKATIEVAAIEVAAVIVISSQGMVLIINNAPQTSLAF